MAAKAFIFMFLAVAVVGSDAVDNYQPTNYDISRNNKLGFGLRDFLDYVLGHGYGGGYPGHGGYHPGGYPSYPNQGYPGGHYGGHYPPGPPGAHPGCPLCDSSVYSYCSHKQAHDSCCCDGSAAYLPFGCRKSDCNFLYANSCDEYNLITRCCCVDLEKSLPVPVVPVPNAVVG